MIATALATLSHLLARPTVQWRCDPYADVQRIYFGNHSSHLDFIVIWSALPEMRRRFVRPVAGRDYWDQGAIRRHLARRVFNAVLIDRGRSESANAVTRARGSIQRIAQEMGDRDSLIVFPEGTRSLTGEVGTFKSGLYHLSRVKPDVELVPVYLENLNRILPKGEMLPVPMSSRVVFGPPLPAGIQEAKLKFLTTARTALVQLKEVQ
jgi:1-acyl-sn-glycerol-3-phosphate acyltransferase